mmetsp:Transcript_33767/g.75855  ORF Transcript_33767/g.75855 Transcript_33767/m.75855 type:complete len:212 (-) Transcript_33767:1115-1750(-)
MHVSCEQLGAGRRLDPQVVHHVLPFVSGHELVGGHDGSGVGLKVGCRSDPDAVAGCAEGGDGKEGEHGVDDEEEEEDAEGAGDAGEHGLEDDADRLDSRHESDQTRQTEGLGKLRDLRAVARVAGKSSEKHKEIEGSPLVIDESSNSVSNAVQKHLSPELQEEEGVLNEQHVLVARARLRVFREHEDDVGSDADDGEGLEGGRLHEGADAD